MVKQGVSPESEFELALQLLEVDGVLGGLHRLLGRGGIVRPVAGEGSHAGARLEQVGLVLHPTVRRWSLHVQQARLIVRH